MSSDELARHPLPSNGVGVHVMPQAGKENVMFSTDEQQPTCITATSNSHDHLHDGHSEASTADELSENFE